ncbi:MAG: DNA primase [Clostridia bacterium]|nr:DNA primase [Clostridia bacterium]NCC44718.1 DNA primase [Clostridia bacterium]
MRYSEDLIEEIRMKSDIVDVISGYVKLQRKGSSYFGLCPFHNEKSPSFSVSPSKQMYYCFGCGAGGNVFTFLMEYENFTFVEALKSLAERAGVELPQLEYSKEAKAQADLKSTILEVNKLAAKYYYFQLRKESAATAMSYLKGRELSDETINKFGLGYSDKYSDDLYRYLKSKNYSDDILRQSGLFNVDERRGMYDKFWNRVIFPIMDVNNRVIGFGGRVMGDAKPKYLNSPETKIFDKSRNLYGLNLARTSRKRNLIICEGYMDVISMHQAGFNNAVASLGTALTSQQASLLKRYTDEVLIIYDSDEAGVKAALRAIPMLKTAGLATKVINLRPYKDPDEFIKNMGQEAFQERLDNGMNSFLFELKAMEQQYDMEDPQGKTDFYKETARKLLRFEDELERSNYIQAVADTYKVPAEDLRKMVNRFALQGAGIQEVVKPKSGINRSHEKQNGFELSQKLMLTWMTSYPEIFGEVARYIGPEDFTKPLYHTVAGMLFEQYEQGQLNPARLLNNFTDSEEQKEVAGVFNAQIPLETDEERKMALLDVICRLKEDSIAHKSAQLAPTDMQGLMDLMQSKKELEDLRAGKLHLHISFN